MTQSPAIVYKIGGSLLDLPDLAKRIEWLVNGDYAGPTTESSAWMKTARPILVVGGGAAADLVREWDRIHSLGAERSHSLALLAMQWNEQLILEILPNCRRVTSRDKTQAAWADNAVPVVSAFDYLAIEEQAAGKVLPHSWDVTSDSIAAWIAVRWNAEALVLAKSVDPPSLPTNGWHDCDTVDRYFARLASEIPKIGWINLRAENATIRWMTPNQSESSV